MVTARGAPGVSFRELVTSPCTDHGSMMEGYEEHYYFSHSLPILIHRPNADLNFEVELLGIGDNKASVSSCHIL